MCNELKKFMRKFTVITKDGSKWLRPSLGTATHLISPDLPYIGSRPEGTILDESGVKEVEQYRQKDNENADWKIWTTGVIDWDCVIETRTVYRDAESHDRHIRPFNTHNVRPLVGQLVGEEISFSRFIELLNGIANTH